jgi:glycosyltransferase involved in cell wall biosynthesis
MNILVLTAYPPVLHMHGGGVRMFHNIRILAERHQVRVISFVESDEERALLHSLHGICDSVKTVRRIPEFRSRLFSLSPFFVGEFGTPEMYRAVEMECRNFKIDVLQCEYLSMAQFHRKGVLNVLTLHEARSANAWKTFEDESNPVHKLRDFYRWMSVLRYETMMCRTFDRVITMTEDDAAYLRSYSPQADIRAIPIGIDLSEFAPAAEKCGTPVDVLFVGNFRHYPNTEAAEFLVDRVAAELPDVRFLIAGARPPDHLRNARPNVFFPGYVPDLRTLYRGPDTIVAAPLFSGTGQRVKLLEAFAMGSPVVTTATGARGFPVRHGIHALIANTCEEYTSALRQLISSPNLRRQLGANARRMMEQGFSWEEIGTKFLQVVGT